MFINNCGLFVRGGRNADFSDVTCKKCQILTFHSDNAVLEEQDEKLPSLKKTKNGWNEQSLFLRYSDYLSDKCGINL